MIVVDVGCMPQGVEESVHSLISQFAPDVLFGFDPFPDLVDGVEHIGSTIVIRRRAAAWTHTGTVPFRVQGICSGVALKVRPYEEVAEVPCIDLCAFLAALPSEDGLVLKLDAEGSEYPLLNAIRDHGLDRRLELVLVEWHSGVWAHGLNTKRPELRCPVAEWETPEPVAVPAEYRPVGPTSAVLGSRVRPA